MDQLERDVRALLTDRAADLPGRYEPPAALAGRVARRRTTKMAGAGFGAALVVAIAAGAISTAATTKSKRPRVITSVPTTIVKNTTNQTAPRVTTKIVVPSAGCPTSSVAAPFEVAAPEVGARKIAGLDATVANRVRSFVGPRAGFATDARALEPDVVLGPKDWTCRVYQSNGGGAVMYVFPTSAQGSFGAGGFTTSEKYAGPEVRVVTAVLGHDPDISLACAVFAGDPVVQQWAASSVVQSSCAPPSGRHITKRAAGVYSFVDGDGTRGVGVMRVRATTPQLDGDFGVVTCKLTGAAASLCDAIISDYSTRYPGSVPGALPVRGPGGVVTTSGRVGGLQFARSTDADLRSAIGTPDATTRASFLASGATAGSLLPDYQALGYDCTATSTPARIPLVVQPAVRGPYCATIYFINVATKTLAAFETTSPEYATARGTAFGMTPAEAQNREGKSLVPSGCLGSFIQLGSLYQNGSTSTIAKTAAVVVIFVGPNAGDRVFRIEAESNVNPVGKVFC